MDFIPLSECFHFIFELKHYFKGHFTVRWDENEKRTRVSSSKYRIPRQKLQSGKISFRKIEFIWTKHILEMANQTKTDVKFRQDEKNSISVEFCHFTSSLHWAYDDWWCQMIEYNWQHRMQFRFWILIWFLSSFFHSIFRRVENVFTNLFISFPFHWTVNVVCTSKYM